MTLLSRAVGLVGRLPKAQTHRIEIERDLVVTMADGVRLYADRYAPSGAGEAAPLPIVLLRVPYGRSGFAILMARLFAERGYQAVVQEVRGTGVSEGTFNALRDEREDGLRTLEWLAEQPWFSGSVGMAGISYLGYAQWAVAADAPPFVKALSIHVSASEFRSGLYHGGTFALYTTLRWAAGMGTKSTPMREGLRARFRNRNRLTDAFSVLPLRDADLAAAGEHVGFFQDWLEHDAPGDPFWAVNDYSVRMDDVTAAVSLIAGWYDILLQRQLADYEGLRDAGRTVRLTVGPWHHTQPAGFLAGLRDGIDWLDAHLRDVPSRRTAPVRIFVMGAGAGWRALPDWPPPATAQRWNLQPDRGLGPEAPPDSAPGGAAASGDRYRYDPSDPTPSLRGILLRGDAGPGDDRALERRADVLTYTSAPLVDDLEVIGAVSAEVFVRTSRPQFDLFVRLCDVKPNGKSVNVCDGPVRVSPERFPPDAEGVQRVPVDLWPTAYRFGRGNRLRVHVASGAHPRIARNLGGGDPLPSATELYVVEVDVLRDPAHPSALILSVSPAGASSEVPTAPQRTPPGSRHRTT